MSATQTETGKPFGPKSCWRLRPTVSGVGFILICGLIFLLGVNYSNNLIFTFCFLLLGVYAVSLWLGVRNLTAFSAECLPVDSVHAGQQLNYRINVAELGGREHLALLTADGTALADLSCSRNDNHSQQWQLQLASEARGVQSSRPLRVQSSWPLGLIMISRQVCQLPGVVIYPRSEDLRALQSRPAGSAAHLHEEAESLAGLREYQPGDNLRRIDWRAMARRDQLQVKQFDGAAGDPSVWLYWEDTERLEYEARIRCLCHWILDCHQRGQEYGLALPQQQFEPGCDQVQLYSCLTALALMPENSVQQTAPAKEPETTVKVPEKGALVGGNPL